jgi:hypothetical protein
VAGDKVVANRDVKPWTLSRSLYWIFTMYRAWL